MGAGLSPTRAQSIEGGQSRDKHKTSEREANHRGFSERFDPGHSFAVTIEYEGACVRNREQRLRAEPASLFFQF